MYYTFLGFENLCVDVLCVFLNHLFRNQSQPVDGHGTIFDGLNVKSTNCQ